MNSHLERKTRTYVGVIRYGPKHPEYSYSFYEMQFDENLNTIKSGTVKYFRKDMTNTIMFSKTESTLELSEAYKNP